MLYSKSACTSVYTARDIILGIQKEYNVLQLGLTIRFSEYGLELLHAKFECLGMNTAGDMVTKI